MAIEAQFYLENLGFAFEEPQNFFMDNGFNFIYQPHKLMQFQDFCHQRKQNNMKDNQSIAFSHGISAHLEKQGTDIDRFINLQNESLRLALQEQRKQQTALILKFYDSKTRFLLQQKEAEIADVSNRTLELQKYIKIMEIENQTWQRVVRENESMVASLNNTIRRLTGTGA